MIKKCPKCSAKMVKGARPDSTYGGIVRESWVPDEYFRGKKVSYDFLGRRWKKQSKQVDSFCCEKCGFLESYVEKK